MAGDEELAGRFEEHRGHLKAVAYRMLGSLAEAEDAVQEAWLRLSRSDADAIDNLGGWLTTVVARVSLNMLRSRATRRETELVDGHVPDPLIDRADAVDPEHQALLADLRALPEARLFEPINDPRNRATGAGVTRYVLLHGLAQHHAYHAGQIAILSKF